MTYSIVARDPETGALGVAVQSHYFSVGSVVPWAEPGVGAVATQAFAETSYGPLGVARMREGADAREALDGLLAADPGQAFRQVAMVDGSGALAAHTGAACVAAAGQRTGEQVSAQGNMLVSPRVWEAMIDAYEAASGELADRLLAALDAAEEAGGDIRGRQSAAILVVGGERLERPWEGVLVDVRVEDHPAPLPELRRLVGLRRAYNRIAGVLLGEGLLLGDPSGADPAELEAGLAALAESQGTLDANPEATFWRAILLARAGRLDEARADLARAIAATPQLAEFLRRLPVAGFVDAELAERLLS